MSKEIRKRILPSGWYPDKKEEILKIFSEWDKKEQKNNEIKAIIVPHAGWYYSGEIAFYAFSFLDKGIDTVVVAGGHLGENDPPLAAKNRLFDATIGDIDNNIELLGYLSEEIKFHEDIYSDNTVEIQLPIVKYFLPESKILWLRIPPNYNIVLKTAEAIHNYALENNKKVAVVGSVDLTHYGSNYGFQPHGEGRKGLKWVREVNDKEFIDFVSSFKIAEAIEHGKCNFSSCSSGAAALAAQYAAISNAKGGRLITYKTSYEISPADSFVGYAGIIYE
ncbi:MAG: AmmeMemoRadiSam system protein B [Spirochaetes bacterium]|nr:AmmeMemoRadiSam system protein B [Spirochaetota bacterium]